jgi:hypothetical protein
VRARAWLVALTVVALGCGRAPAAGPRLEHDAYVWQRAWTGAVRAAAAAPPDAIGALRVLAVEVDRGGAHWPAVDLAALTASRRPVVLVARIDGRRRPEELPLARLDRRRRALAGRRASRCAASRSTSTAPPGSSPTTRAGSSRPGPRRRWLVDHRAADLGRQPALPAVAAAVDELVVQVHAVRAPAVFAAATARRELAAVRRRRARHAPCGSRCRPTTPGSPAPCGGAIRSRSRASSAGSRPPPRPGSPGVVWFRLPVLGDDRAWSSTTLAAVIAGAPLAPALTAAVAPAGAERFDVVLVNRGTIAAPWPDLTLTGADLRAELVGGYLPAPTPRAWLAPRRELQPGDEVVIGWATGQEVSIDAM